MNTFVQNIKRNSYSLAALFIASSMIMTNVMLVRSASALQITERSIQMSSSTPSAASQTYLISFKPATASVIQGIVVDFCAENPIIGNGTCTKPTGMTVGTTSPTVTGIAGTWLAATLNTGRTLEVHQAANATSTPAGTAVTVSVGGFTNPSTTGTFYARILTYATKAGADAYTASVPGTHIDDGGVAMSTTETIGVSATVQESLTFCVRKTAPAAACSGGGTPSLTLGQGTPQILDATTVSKDSMYFQLTTNAGGITAINMRGAETALKNGPTNTIPGMGALAVMSAGSGRFGVRIVDGTFLAGGSGVTSGDAAYEAADGSYAMENPINSTYGDTLATASGPVLNVNTMMEFAATAAPTTPAGLYTAQFSLIATPSY